MDALKGYKTYIAAIAIGILAGVRQMGWIDDSVSQGIIDFLTMLGLIAARVGAVKA